MSLISICNTVEAAATSSKDDVLFTAVCDLRSVVLKGNITVDSARMAQILEGLTYGLDQLPQRFHPEWMVKCMAAIQGICPDATWKTWQRLNGC